MIQVERKAWRLQELAQAYGVSVSFLRSEIRKGRLKTSNLGSSVIVLVEEWQRYMGASDEEKAGT